MVEPSGFLYNQHALSFRQAFFARWKIREILDLVSVRGLFKKGEADPKIVVVIAETGKPEPDGRLLHAVFRRNGRATAEQGFDIDYYDLHWLRTEDAERSRDIWRANLLGGSRARDLIERLRSFPTLRDLADKRGWDFGEGYIAGLKGISRPADHLVGKPLLPTVALSESGIDTRFLETVPNRPIKDTKSERRFTPPFLLIRRARRPSPSSGMVIIRPTSMRLSDWWHPSKTSIAWPRSMLGSIVKARCCAHMWQESVLGSSPGEPQPSSVLMCLPCPIPKTRIRT